MRSSFLSAAAGLVVFLMASAGLAETKTLAASGSWKAFGGTTTSGRGVCGISGSPGGRYFGLKFFAGNDTFTVQMQVPQVTNQTKVPVTLKFDANPTWTATGTGFHFDDGDAGVEFPIKRTEADRFAFEFSNSSTAVIQTDSGIFPQWIMGLEGTLSISGAFRSCMNGLPKS